MRLLHPASGEVDLDELYGGAPRRAPGDRPWVLLNMVTSVDGATALDGRSGGLGGEGDRLVFGAVRSIADAVVAGAGTVRAERYGPPQVSPDRRAARTAGGQHEVPAIVVVTRSVDIDTGSPLFVDAERPPLVATVGGADPAAVARVRAAGGEVLEVGDGHVDVRRLLDALGERGHGVIVLEGGPSLNGQFVEADLVDEVTWTVSPTLVGGDAARLAHGPVASSLELDLAHLVEHRGELFARYVRAR